MRWSLFVSLFLALLTGGVSAQGPGGDIDEVLTVYTPAPLGSPVLLKLNAYYLLATYPVAPYRDDQGSVMVPLRIVGELFGGQVYVSGERKSGTLVGKNYTGSEWTTHKLEFRAGSKTAVVDEREVQLVSAPRWLGQHEELIVPLELLLQTFDIAVADAGDEYIVRLENYALLMNFYLLENFFDAAAFYYLPEDYSDTDRLVPRDVSVRYVLDRAETAEVSDVTDTAVMLELRETAGPPIPQGRQGLFIYRVGQGAATLGGRNTSRSMGPSNEDPCVSEGAASSAGCSSVAP